MEKEIEENYQNFWKEIVENPDDSINKEQLKKELFDFSFLMENSSKIYYHITDGLLSKNNYTSKTVIDVADDVFNKLLKEETKKYKKIIKKIRKLSDFENLQSSKDMQNALEEINELCS